MLLVVAHALGVANGGAPPTRSAPILRRNNPRPRVCAIPMGIAPTRLALLVLSTLATCSCVGDYDFRPLQIKRELYMLLELLQRLQR